MDQFKYSTYAANYQYGTDEPNSLMTSYTPNLGVMTGREAFDRVISSPRFLTWEFELREKHSKSR